MGKEDQKKLEQVKETPLSDECVWRIVVLAKGEVLKNDPAFNECYKCLGTSSSCPAYIPYSPDKTIKKPQALEETLEICFWKNIASKRNNEEIKKYPGLLNCYECEGFNKSCKGYSIKVKSSSR